LRLEHGLASWTNASFAYGLVAASTVLMVQALNRRPREYRGQAVPDVLLSGHHEEIRKWRRRQSLLRTLERRPELLAEVELTREDKDILKELMDELQRLNPS
jgi:tRNA (guanine-N1)-methyltransferase